MTNKTLTNEANIHAVMKPLSDPGELDRDGRSVEVTIMIRVCLMMRAEMYWRC